MTAKQTERPGSASPSTEFTELVAAGRRALAQGDLAQARAHFEAVARQFPDEPLGHNNLGAFYMGLGEYAAAEQCFATVVAQLPDNPNTRFNLGMARFRQEKFGPAVADFGAVAAATPADPEVHNNLGAARYQAGDLDQARQDFTTALNLQPNYPRAVLNLCDLELPAGDAAAAIGRCQAYLEHHRDLGVLRRLLELLDAQARLAVDLAIPHAEALVAAAGNDLATRRHLGRLLEARQALSAAS